jgi:hypothetical protein
MLAIVLMDHQITLMGSGAATEMLTWQTGPRGQAVTKSIARL